jgi:hypothetical protein
VEHAFIRTPGRAGAPPQGPRPSAALGLVGRADRGARSPARPAPAVAPSLAIAGSVTAAAATATGLHAGTPVGPCCGASRALPARWQSPCGTADRPGPCLHDRKRSGCGLTDVSTKGPDRCALGPPAVRAGSQPGVAAADTSSGCCAMSRRTRAAGASLPRVPPSRGRAGASSRDSWAAGDWTHGGTRRCPPCGPPADEPHGDVGPLPSCRGRGRCGDGGCAGASPGSCSWSMQRCGTISLRGSMATISCCIEMPKPPSEWMTRGTTTSPSTTMSAGIARRRRGCADGPATHNGRALDIAPAPRLHRGRRVALPRTRTPLTGPAGHVL